MPSGLPSRSRSSRSGSTSAKSSSGCARIWPRRARRSTVRPRRAAGVRRRAREAARLHRPRAAPRGQHDRVQGERRGDHAGRDRDEGRARAVPGADREPGVTARVIVLTAPSGGGKTTIAADVLRRAPDRFGYSVSATTRAPRAGERDGVAYHFSRATPSSSAWPRGSSWSGPNTRVRSTARSNPRSIACSGATATWCWTSRYRGPDRCGSGIRSPRP